MNISTEDKAHVLIEALPYIQKFAGKIIVIKYGGSTITPDSGAVDPVILDIIWMKRVGLQPVIVHGGGKAISHLLERLGHQARFLDGLRVTDETTMEVVEMVLGGQVNKQLVSSFTANGCAAAGLTGVDGGTLQVSRKQHPDGDIGLVGEVQAVDTTLVHTLLQGGFIPVIAPVGLDEHGVRYNVNADSAAGAIAGALGAEKLILLTDVPGIMQETAEGRKVLSQVTPAQIADLIEDGTIRGGMVPKVEACLNALDQGARHVHILNGKQKHALLLEVFTDRGIGTLVRGENEA
ncbi:MAG TPA: acetylglutamate kinase [Bacilli bacterium]|nr:acetylglutamate kinase [Bacilli bacterium]